MQQRREKIEKGIKLVSIWKTNSKPVRWFSLSNINKCYASSDVQLQISLKSPPDISKYDTGEK